MSKKQETEERISVNKVDIRDEIASSFAAYAKDVIMDRALPDIRDGLLPVQRRVIYGMHKMRLLPTNKQVKSARIVGEVMGKYHPHGDVALYGAMARLSKEWVMRHPLVTMFGNNGSVDGDTPAAMRYCVVGDTLVTLADGQLIAIQDIVPGALPDTDTDIDLWVKDYQGNAVHASKFFHSGEHDTLKITLQNGNSLTGSHNHPVLVLTNEEGVPTLVWKTFEELQPGDYVTQYLDTNTLTKGEDYTDDLFATFLGGIVSEGYIDEKRLYFSNTDKEFYDVMISYLNTIGTKYVERTRELPSGKPLYEVEIVAVQELYKGMEDVVGRRSGTQEVPNYVLSGSRGTQIQFLQSLFEGDGSVSHTHRRSNTMSVSIFYASKSEKLISQLQILLYNFGINSIARKEYGRDAYRLEIYGDRNIRQFQQSINFLTEKRVKLESLIGELDKDVRRSVSISENVPYIAEYIRGNYVGGVPGGFKRHIDKQNFTTLLTKTYDKNKVVMEYIEREHPEVWELLDNDYLFSPVKSIEDAGKQHVYSIKVDTEDHSFITNGIVSHNTEARLSKPALKLLEGLSKQGVVDWQKNYDDALDEPQFLPAQFPNILVNGASGISVGYASDIPPHNLKEVLESCILILDDPTLTFEQLAIQGPDFPTGAEIINKNELARIYNVGEGSIRVRAKYYLEETSKRSKYNKLVFYEMPYNIKKPDVLLQIKTLLDQKLLNGVGSVMDDSNKEGTRLVLNIEKGVNHASLADVLYQKTSLQANVTYNCVVIADGKPRVLGINELLRRYNKFRVETVRRELEADNEVDRKRLHILDGMLILADNVKDIIAIIEKSKTKDESRQALIRKYQLSVEQANTILELQLHRINRASKEDFQTEHNQRTQQLAHRQNILNTKALLLQYVKDGYMSLIEEFKATTKRLTTVTSEEVKVNVDIESMIQLEDVAVGVTPDGYIKRSSIRSYQSTESAYNGFSLETNTHKHVLLFTTKGNYIYLPVHELKEGRWGDEGSHLSTMGVEFLEGEQIVSVSEYEEDALVFILRKSGTGKVSHAKDFPVSRHSAIYTCGGVEDGDEVYFAGLVSEQDTLAISTKQELKTKTKYGSFLLNIYDLAPIGVKAKGRKLVKLSKTKDIINCVTVQGDGEETKFNTGTNDIELTPILPYKLFNQQPNTLTDPQLLAPKEEPNESDLEITDTKTEESIQVGNQEQTQGQEEV